VPTLSNSRVDRAGDAIRAYIDDRLESRDVLDDWDIIGAYRGVHAKPLNAVAANLRYYAEKHTRAGIVVGQRLKRMYTICDKLTREPALRLSQMQDIGGCRVVLGDERELRALVADLCTQRRWDIVRQYDYIATPKPVSGYRAYHLVVRKERCLVEVQVRTRPQHGWAELVERVDREHRLGLKEGRAPAEIVEYYRLGALLVSSAERRSAVDDETMARFRELHPMITQFLASKTNGT
jgi:ppGpp synthetase/RelA/SpoT-type nucleotidyltranferase